MSEPESDPTAGYPVTIARIEVKLDGALAAHAEEKREVRRALERHDKRISTIERWVWALPVTLLVAIAGAGAGYGQLLGR